MKEQETHADIIAEMRGARTEFPFVYLIGEPDTPEVIDSKTKEIVEPRKINIRRVTVTELADRLEAANRRERGDYAKLREVVECVAHMNDDGYWNSSAQICNLVALASAALGATSLWCTTNSATPL